MSNTNYATVNGHRVYYEVQGSGKPLILLHGGVLANSFGGNLGELAKARKLIAVHLQGHGQTPTATARFARGACSFRASGIATSSCARREDGEFRS